MVIIWCLDDPNINKEKKGNVGSALRERLFKTFKKRARLNESRPAFVTEKAGKCWHLTSTVTAPPPQSGFVCHWPEVTWLYASHSIYWMSDTIRLEEEELKKVTTKRGHSLVTTKPEPCPDKRQREHRRSWQVGHVWILIIYASRRLEKYFF